MSLSPDRARRIGCSDIAPILGVSPFRTAWDVYARIKHGIDPWSDDEAKARGRRFERMVIEEVEARLAPPSTHILCTGMRPLTHPSLPWFVGTPDALSIPHDSAHLVSDGDGIEAKCLHERGGWGEPCTIEAWTDEHVGRVPAYYALQVYGYLAITGARAWHLGVAFTDHVQCLTPAQVYTFLPDPQTQADIVEALTAWHERYIVGDDEPPIDGSDACTAALAQRFPGAPDKVARPATDDEVDLLVRYAQLRGQIARLENERDTVGNQIRAAMGDGWKLFAPGISATLSLGSESRRLVGLSEVEKHPDILAALDAAGLVRTSTSKRTLNVRTPKE